MWSWSFWHNSNRVILWMLLCSEKILLQGEEDENHKIHFTLKMEPSFTYSYQWSKSKTTNEISINILWNFPFFGHRKITFVQVRDWSRWRCVIWNWQPSSWHPSPLPLSYLRLITSPGFRQLLHTKYPLRLQHISKRETKSSHGDITQI